MDNCLKKQVDKYSNNFYFPEEIRENIVCLNGIISKYPKKIPVAVVANFLGMDVECLKRCIECGNVPFAIGCNENQKNRYSYISATTFYLWYLSPFINQSHLI